MNRTLRICPVGACTFAADRPFFIRVNRALAWALVVSPAGQLLVGSSFAMGLGIDAALLVAHGMLSLALFGKPGARGAERWWLWLGIEPGGLGRRQRFLMTGWCIALAAGTAPAAWLGMPGILYVAVPMIVVWAFLPLRIIEHVFKASVYAARRWNGSDADEAAAMAMFVVLLWLLTGLTNLLR